MKIVQMFIVVVLCGANNSFAQEPDLVPNGGFEDYINCPNDMMDFFGFTKHWYSPTNASPDFFHVCANQVNQYIGIPAMNCGQFPKNGNGMAGMGVHNRLNRQEYIAVKLREPLVVEQYYRVRYFAMKSCSFPPAIKDIQFQFSVDSIFLDTGYYPILPIYSELIEPGEVFMVDPTTWYKLEFNFKATGGERYLAIGNFRYNSETDVINDTSLITSTAYYFIDDVSVRRIDPPNGIDEEFNLGLELYPNPAANTVVISSKGNKRIKGMTVADLSGRVVQSHDREVRELDISGLSNGVYLVTVEFEGGGRAVQKLVKE